MPCTLNILPAKWRWQSIIKKMIHFGKRSPLVIRCRKALTFMVKANYVDKDSLALLENNLLTNYPTIISEFQTPKETVAGVSQFVKTTTLVLLVIAIILSILVIISIDNTIRLAMYSNRFFNKDDADGRRNEVVYCKASGWTCRCKWPDCFRNCYRAYAGLYRPVRKICSLFTGVARFEKYDIDLPCALSFLVCLSHFSVHIALY